LIYFRFGGNIFVSKFMKLTIEQVEHIARLARLNLTAQEKAKYAEQLSGILEYMDALQTVDTTAVEPTSQVTGLVNISRDDRIIESGISEELVACAPVSRDGYVVIPKVFENK
jgi:aspartyl-tRNA(Asn)/glutamyl-tRNA(Gln) amidotransferase subunit C